MSQTKKILSSTIGILLVVALTACAKSPQATPTAAPSETAAPATQAATVEPSATLSFPATDTPAAGEQPAQPPPAGAGTAAPGSAAAGTPQATVPAGSVPTLPPAVLPTQAPAVTSPGRSTTDSYAFVSQSIADNSHVSPGATVTIIWSVKNTGKVAWSVNYTLRFFSGVPASLSSYNFSKVVEPGKTINLPVTFVAPSFPGNYDTWWKLQNDKGQNFGDVDFAFIIGSGSGPTPTK